MNIVYNELLKNHTSFKIGGPADEFCSVTSVDEIRDLVEYAKEKNIPVTIMGNGSNLLVSDKGIRGLVIKLAKGFDEITIEGTKIVSQSGILLSKLSNLALKAGLTGLEFASGIPGTLGGAVCMNAGAYDGEMKDVVKKVVYYKDGKIQETEELDFSYRHSVFSDTDAVVLSVEMELKEGNYEEIKAKMEDFSQRRSDKQPLSQPSAGSTFKRPTGYFAAKLIEDAGLKGYKIGGAMVSDKHAGFVVNTGDATCDDVVKLIRHIQNVVLGEYGVELETEVKLLGEF